MLVEDIAEGCHESFQVKITKALEQFWYDEKERRIAHGIDKDTDIPIDYSKNVEVDPDVVRGEKDPLWINFLSKGDNFRLLQQSL